MQARSCSTCMFWRLKGPINRSETLGSCHFTSPIGCTALAFVKSADLPRHRWVWPETEADDFCAWYEARPPDTHDVASLVRALADRGISVGVNYMIGYPDETLEEIQTTINMAKRHMAAGAHSANFMLVIPLPGTRLHDEAIRKGHLDENFNPDTFNWRQASMKNTTVPAGQLEQIRQEAWEELNVLGETVPCPE